MSQTRLRGHRRWWILAAILIVGVIAAVPVASVIHHMFDNAVGRTTVVKNADGTERTVYWREYPGVAGIDPQQVLDGPTPQQGYDAGQTMITEIKAALSEELRLQWAPVADKGGSPFHRPIENHYGGESLLINVNGPESQSITVPQTWEEKQRAISIIEEVARRYGFDALAIDGLESWSAEDRIRDLGGLTPDQQVIVSGVALGRAGQWLAFRFQDLSKDAKGTFTERLRPPEGAQWQMNTMALSYGANGLLAAEDRNEFESRMESFHGLIPPAPLES
ncbi:hypothetical protein [Pseudarthrobacter scleromae]|uniref:DUF4015 domain-containing protein n=1 Tax=Pseudarthrobacter scleromae TaxID=158897 RepID=A0ABQ2CG50_9MICC|nr:hypothetical protein [Pseudarthrobacter scleromae]GGI87380.1 hypothetical protein GCM10007175_25760 [Pseudarthrobacter scleromae]